MSDLKPFIPSKEYLAKKLLTKKALKRKPKRQFKVLTDKLTREHVRMLYKTRWEEINKLIT